MSSLVIFSALILSIFAQEPSEYVLSFDTSDNPLDIPIVRPFSKNYFIILGDWGAEKDSPDVEVQHGVATKLKAYVANQTALGMNLMFILALGDNFYYTGQNCAEGGQWDYAFKEVYDDLATDYPWFAMMGNHDWGDSDKGAMCAWVGDPYYIDPSTNIPYQCNQLDSSKGGCAPDNYYFPDFGYYYRIDELNFELITLEESEGYCPGDIGGGYGVTEVLEHCSNHTGIEKGAQIGCGYLGKIKSATENMMVDRAKNSKNSNFVIAQHYPGEGKRIIDEFRSNRTDNGNNDVIVGVYGHSHEQQCDRTATDPYGNKICDLVRSGGGGGCCFQPGSSRGFYVMSFDNNGHLIQPLDIKDPQIECKYPCSNAEFTEEDMDYYRYNYCCIVTEKSNWEEMDCTGVKCEL